MNCMRGIFPFTRGTDWSVSKIFWQRSSIRKFDIEIFSKLKYTDAMAFLRREGRIEICIVIQSCKAMHVPFIHNENNFWTHVRRWVGLSFEIEMNFLDIFFDSLSSCVPTSISLVICRDEGPRFLPTLIFLLQFLPAHAAATAAYPPDAVDLLAIKVS